MGALPEWVVLCVTHPGMSCRGYRAEGLANSWLVWLWAWAKVVSKNLKRGEKGASLNQSFKFSLLMPGKLL